MIETVLKCPLGKLCEEAKDGKIYRCMWLVETEQLDANGRPIEDTRDKTCAIPMLSVHLSQLKMRTLGVQHAVESARNETTKQSANLLELVRQENAIVSRQ